MSRIAAFQKNNADRMKKHTVSVIFKNVYYWLKEGQMV